MTWPEPDEPAGPAGEPGAGLISNLPPIRAMSTVQPDTKLPRDVFQLHRVKNTSMPAHRRKRGARERAPGPAPRRLDGTWAHFFRGERQPGGPVAVRRGPADGSPGARRRAGPASPASPAGHARAAPGTGTMEHRAGQDRHDGASRAGPAGAGPPRRHLRGKRRQGHEGREGREALPRGTHLMPTPKEMHPWDIGPAGHRADLGRPRCMRLAGHEVPARERSVKEAAPALSRSSLVTVSPQGPEGLYLSPVPRVYTFAARRGKISSVCSLAHRAFGVWNTPLASPDVRPPPQWPAFGSPGGD